MNREKTNLTFDPILKKWATWFARKVRGESLSRYIDRLISDSRARDLDRKRKEAAK